MDGDEIQVVDPTVSDGGGTPTVTDTTAVDSPAVQPDPAATSGTPDVANDGSGDDEDPYAGLYEKLDDAAAVDPNAPPASTSLPPELTQAAESSQYFKDPAQLPAAIQMADQLQGVRTGSTHTGDFIDQFRTVDPTRHAAILDEAVEYLTAIGKIKADAVDAKPIDPEVAALRSEMQKIQQAETERVQERAKQEFEAQRTQTTQKYTEHLTGLIKGTWLEGTEGDFGNRVLGQLDKMGVKPADFAAALAKGDTAQLDKAVKMAKNEVLDLVKMYNKNLLDKKGAFRRVTPISPGQGGGPVKTSTNGLPQRSQFPAGDEGESQFHKAMAEAAFK